MTRQVLPPLGRSKRAILLYLAEHGPATIRDLGSGVGLRSSSTTWYHVRDLYRAGLVTYDPGHNHTLRLHSDIFVSDKGNVYWLALGPEAFDHWIAKAAQ